ncbi:MAG TPA: hypothetical protein VER11_25250 [Polyangiaceae bacterium]|nr:hypothetical protein [Polyangiaceae bacterium]
MPNSAQIVFALAMAVWVVDVRFAPKPAPASAVPEAVCQSGPSSEAPAGADLEVVVCAQRGK